MDSEIMLEDSSSFQTTYYPSTYPRTLTLTHNSRRNHNIKLSEQYQQSIQSNCKYRRHDTIQEEQHSWMSGFQSPYIAEA